MEQLFLSSCFFLGSYVFSQIAIGNIKMCYISFYCFQNCIWPFRNGIKKILLHKSINSIVRDVKTDLFKQTINHEYTFFEKNMSGLLTNKINNIANKMEGIFINFINSVVDCSCVFGCSYFFFQVNHNLAYIYLISVSIMFFILYFLQIKLRKQSEITSHTISQSIGTINDSFVNIGTIKSFATEETEYRKLKKETINISRSQKIERKYYFTFYCFLYLLTSFVIFIVSGYGYHLLNDNKITFDSFLFALSSTTMTTYFIKDISSNLLRFLEDYGTFKNSFETLNQPVKIIDKTENNLKINEGKIVIKNLDFKYDK
jgi:ATP-binding cassette subfamily B multidrug efflux pump